MSSISNAYKLQIEKLTNKINQVILENRKLYRYISEAAPASDAGVSTIPGKEQTLSADTGVLQYTPTTPDYSSTRNYPWDNPSYFNPGTYDTDGNGVLEGKELQNYLEALKRVWEWFFRQFGYNSQSDIEWKEWLEKYWEIYPYFIPPDANPLGYPAGIPGVYRPASIIPFGMTWDQWQIFWKYFYQTDGVNPGGVFPHGPGMPIDVGSPAWWEAVRKMRQILGNPNWLPFMNPYWLEQWTQQGNSWPPQEP